MSGVPVLDARPDVASCDYPAAAYECRVTSHSRGAVAIVRHELRGAPALEELIQHGKARFAVEVRSPAAFTGRLHIAEKGERRHEVPVGGEELAAADCQVLPGLLAVEACSLSLRDCGESWRRLGKSRRVPAGLWLARAQHHDVRTPQQSLLTFVEDIDGTLERGHMRIGFRHDGSPLYEVSMHKDDLAACLSDASRPAAQAVVLAAWTAALADAGTQHAFSGNDAGEREPLGAQLADLLHNVKCPAPGEDNYDPLLAATSLQGHELLNSLFSLDDPL